MRRHRNVHRPRRVFGFLLLPNSLTTRNPQWCKALPAGLIVLDSPLLVIRFSVTNSLKGNHMLAEYKYMFK